MAWLARCATIYMLAYSAPQLVSTLPGVGGLSDRWMSAVGFVARWFMAHALRLPEHSPPVPSWYLDHRPDDLTELVGCLLLAGVALLVGTIWTLFRPRGPAWGRWQSLAHLVTRFALASIMIVYGWSKLLPQQFNGGQVPPSWLLWRLGDFTPTHLLWIFMGYSRPYAIFAGAGEMLGALLLCTRRTATAGALILIAILSNVVAMNLAYDVAVKVGAVNFLLMAAFIAAPDAARLANFLFRSRPDAQGWFALHLGRIRLRWIAPTASLLFTLWLVVSPLPSISENIGGLHASRPEPPSPAGLFEITPAKPHGLRSPDSHGRNGTSLFWASAGPPRSLIATLSCVIRSRGIPWQGD